MRPFAALAACTCPPHEEMLLATAAELGPVDVRDAEAWLDALAAELPAPSGSAEADLRAVAQLIREELTCDPGGSLTLPDVLEIGGGHPLVVAGAAVAVAARRGYDVDVVGHGPVVWLAHPDAAPLLVDVTDGSLVDARLIGVDVEWRCAHELAQMTLAHLGERAERYGNLSAALHAAELAAALPDEHA
ncbi:MAG TPA: hypothetical protein VN238_21515, partial [Solirubrobacteraceae bacterium]|nr:hypothetical protein [Solirubrobacteraceae bacterium]